MTGAHPGPSRRQLLAGLAAGGAVVASAGSAHAATTSPSPSPTSTESSLPLAVVLLDVTPSAYSASDPARSTIVVRARVDHRGPQALSGLTARLVAQRTPTVARSALDGWARASDRTSITRSSASSDDVVVGTGTLAPEESAEVTLTVQAAALGSGLGAHLAAVEVSDDSGRVGVARTFLVPAPTGVTPTRLTLLLPLVAGRDGATDGLAAAVQDRLGALVTASADPRIAWGLDPALLAAVEDVAPSGQPGATPSPTGPAPSASQSTSADTGRLADWRNDLRAAANRRVIVQLPYGDPDLAALDRSTSGPDLLTRAVTAGAGALGSSGGTVLTSVAWPADEAADDDVLALAVSAGANTVVLDDRCLAPDDELTYTPTGRATVDVLDTQVEALVADRTMSSVLADASDPDQAVLVRQRLLAEVATTTLQRPSNARGLLLVASRSFVPAAGALEGLVTDLETSGWANWQPLTDLLATAAPAAERSGPAVPTATARAALPSSHVASVALALADVDDFASALQLASGQQDAALLAQQRAALLLLGASWRGHREELPAARAELTAAVTALTRSVSIVGGSVRNLAAERSELPITVVNELDVPVQVDLVLRPRSPRVQLDTVPRQTVAARSQQRVAVPVRALANGSVVVVAQLRTPTGSPIGESVDVDLNVRADVENWISGVVGGGAAALLVLGLVRAVKRGRRRVDEAEQADIGGDAPDTADETPTPGAGAGAQDESATTGQG